MGHGPLAMTSLPFAKRHVPYFREPRVLQSKSNLLLQSGCRADTHAELYKGLTRSCNTPPVRQHVGYKFLPWLYFAEKAVAALLTSKQPGGWSLGAKCPLTVRPPPTPTTFPAPRLQYRHRHRLLF